MENNTYQSRVFNLSLVPAWYLKKNWSGALLFSIGSKCPSVLISWTQFLVTCYASISSPTPIHFVSPSHFCFPSTIPVVTTAQMQKSRYLYESCCLIKYSTTWFSQIQSRDLMYSKMQCSNVSGETRVGFSGFRRSNLMPTFFFCTTHTAPVVMKSFLHQTITNYISCWRQQRRLSENEKILYKFLIFFIWWAKHF